MTHILHYVYVIMVNWYALLSGIGHSLNVLIIIEICSQFTYEVAYVKIILKAGVLGSDVLG